MDAPSSDFAISVYKTDQGLYVEFKFANFWWFVCKHQSNISIALNTGLFALIFYKLNSDIKRSVECDEAGAEYLTRVHFLSSFKTMVIHLMIRIPSSVYVVIFLFSFSYISIALSRSGRCDLL